MSREIELGDGLTRLSQLRFEPDQADDRSSATWRLQGGANSTLEPNTQFRVTSGNSVELRDIRLDVADYPFDVTADVTRGSDLTIDRGELFGGLDVRESSRLTLFSTTQSAGLIKLYDTSELFTASSTVGSVQFVTSGSWIVAGPTVVTGDVTGPVGGTPPAIEVSASFGGRVILDTSLGNRVMRGSISGSGAVEVRGGVYEFTTPQSFRGGLFLTGGQLTVSGGSRTGALDNTIHFAGGRLNVTQTTNLATQNWRVDANSVINAQASNSTVTISGDFAGAARLRKIGEGALALTGDNSAFAGELLIENGDLLAGAGDSLGDDTLVTLDNTSLTLQGSENFGAIAGNGSFNLGSFSSGLVGDRHTEFAGSVTGSGALSRRGNGSLRLSGSLQAFAGDLNVSGGELILERFVITDYTGTATTEAGGTLTMDTAGSDRIYTGTLVNRGRFAKAGGGTLTVTGIANQGGTVEVAEGVLASGAVQGDHLVLSGGTFRPTLANLAYDTIHAADGSGGTLDVGVSTFRTRDGLSGGGTITKTGAGRFEFFSQADNASFTGVFGVRQGTLELSRSLPSGGINLSATGAAEVTRPDRAVGSLAGSGSLQLLSSDPGEAASLRVGGDNSDSAFDGNITGVGDLIKEGAGEFSFRGDASAWVGSWAAEEGRLLFDSGERPAGDIAASAGGTVVFRPETGESAYAGSLSGDGAFVMEGSGTLNLTGDNSGFSGALRVTPPSGQGGVLNVNGTIAPTSASVDANATLGGNGDLLGPATVMSEGTIRPAVSGRLRVDSAEFRDRSTFGVDIASISEFSTLSAPGAGGDVTVNGATLDVDLLDGFVPSLGDTYHVLSVDGELSGTGFAEFDLPELPAGRRWDARTLMTSGVIAVGMPGDFNNDGELTASDLDALFAAGAAGAIDPFFDLNVDGRVTTDVNATGLASDIDYMVRELLRTEYGDLDLDGQIDGADFSTLLGGFGPTGSWATGDINGDGVVDGVDFSTLLNRFGFRDADAEIAFGITHVPEPSSLALLVLASGLACRRRGHSISPDRPRAARAVQKWLLVGAFTAMAISNDTAEADLVIESTESSPGVFDLTLTTDTLFHVIEIGVNGDVSDGLNIVPTTNVLLPNRLIDMASSPITLLSPLGNAPTAGVFEPGLNSNIDLTYGVTQPIPLEWTSGLSSTPMLRFTLQSGEAEATVKLFRGSAVVGSASIPVGSVAAIPEASLGVAWACGSLLMLASRGLRRVR